jgi:hypothetical protein
MSTAELILHVKTAQVATDNATVYLNNLITDYLIACQFSMPQGSKALREGQAIDANNFDYLVWRFANIGYKKPKTEGLAQTITVSSVQYHEMTWNNLFSGAKSMIGKKELLQLKHIQQWLVVFIGVDSILP